MQKFITLIVFISSVFGQCAVANDLQKLTIDGRDVFFHQAGGQKQSGALIVALHGAFGSGKKLQSIIGRGEHTYGASVAYLNGSPMKSAFLKDAHVWNAGECCGAAAQSNAPDLEHINSVIRYFVGKGIAKKETVFLLGHSNGSMMAYRYACEGSYAVRGVIAISGPLAQASCKDARGTQVLHIHGRADQNVPLMGGSGSKGVARYEFISARASAQRMIAGGAQVEMLVVENGAHSLKSLNKAMRREKKGDLMKVISKFVQDSQN